MHIHGNAQDQLGQNMKAATRSPAALPGEQPFSLASGVAIYIRDPEHKTVGGY